MTSKLENHQASSSSSISETSAYTVLPNGFVPGKLDVICSLGRKAKSHIGNVYLQTIIEQSASKYALAVRKHDKTIIVDKIVATIQERSRSYKERENDDDGGGERGGFLKIIDGKWNIVDGKLAKEKISQSLRDILAGQYCSSLVSKKKKRRESNLQRIVDFDKIVQSNKFVLKTMIQLQNTIQDCTLSDQLLLELMNQSSTNILHHLKQNQSVQQKVQLQNMQRQQQQRSYSPSLNHKTKRIKAWSYEERKYDLCFH